MRSCAHVVACVATAGVLSRCLRDTSHLCETAGAWGCGNDALEAGETCDDGNFRPRDACTTCTE